MPRRTRWRTSCCVPPPSGLVSWWRGEGNALDQTGTNNGTLVGNTTYGSGEVGQGFVLDGTGDAVRVSNPPELQLQNFTIEVWLKRASTTLVTGSVGNNGLVFSYGTGGYGFGLDTGGRPLLSQIDNNMITATAAVTDTNFHHVAVAKLGTNVVFYIDGVAYSAPVYGNTFSFSTSAAVGARGDTSGNSFLGSVDEVSLYNRALTAAEIQSIYTAGSSGKCVVGVPPAIVSQPASQTVPVGSNVLFSATATGTPPLIYQWSFNGTNLAAATTSLLSLTNVQLNQAGVYAVLVTNLYGVAVSSNASLTVTGVPPAIASQPASRAVPVGSNVLFSVVASGTPPLSYQWSFNGTNLAGATTSSLSLTNVQLNQAGLYAALVTNLYGSVLSSNASLTVTAVPPAIISQPASRSVPPGGNVTFSVTATGTPPLSYQWRFNGADLVGQTTNSLALINVQTNAAGNYSVLVTNVGGSVLSSNALLVVLVPQTNCTPPPSGLVSWWRAEGDATDQAGTNNGTLAGNASYGLGRVGLGFVLDGTGDGVRVGNPTNCRLQTFTIEGWLQRASTTLVSGTVTNGMVFSFGSGGYGFGLNTSGRPFLSWVDHISVASTNSITDTNFHHVAVTKSGANVVLYIDGAGYAVLPPFTNTFTFSASAAIGARGDTLGNSFLGTLDEVSLYNRALSATELQAIYTAGSSGKCPPNHAPTAANTTAATRQNQPLTIAVEKLLALASDPDGDPLTLSAVSATSTNGGVVSLLTDTVIYTPVTNFTGADQFTYTVSDGRGGTASGYVLVQVRGGDQGSGNMLSPQSIPGGFLISFAGIPGRTYTLQRAGSVTGPWTSLAAITLGPGGIASYADTNAPPANAYYRTVYP